LPARARWVKLGWPIAVEEVTLPRRTVTGLAAAALCLAVAPSSSAQPGSHHGGCAAFGANVSGLAQTLGPAFGATASGVATSAPGAFPTVVVHPEQAMLCEP
jgi:hypothetical protein